MRAHVVPLAGLRVEGPLRLPEPRGERDCGRFCTAEITRHSATKFDLPRSVWSLLTSLTLGFPAKHIVAQVCIDCTVTIKGSDHIFSYFQPLLPHLFFKQERRSPLKQRRTCPSRCFVAGVACPPPAAPAARCSHTLSGKGRETCRGSLPNASLHCTPLGPTASSMQIPREH